MAKKRKSTKLAADKKFSAAPIPVLTPGFSVPKAVKLLPESKLEPRVKIASDGVSLNFRVPTSFRRDFRSYAARHDMKLNELLRAAFEEYKARHP